MYSSHNHACTPQLPPTQGRSTSTTRRSLLGIPLHLSSCFSLSLLLTKWEDFDCTTLSPGSTYIHRDLNSPHPSLKGLGSGESTRLKTLQYAPQNTANIRTYNEIMSEYYSEIKPMTPGYKASAPTVSDLKSDVRTVKLALLELDKLSALSSDYDLQGLQSSLQSPLLTTRLRSSLQSLRSSPLLPPSSRSEIGFDWGSCAWRRCGAHADAQEALAELQRDAGMLEPFECEFVIEVARRSLRDVIGVVPREIGGELGGGYWDGE